MDTKSPIRTGGHILIDQLALHGADTVFGVPGESFLAALDGMYQNQRVRFINARQEGGATMMADAYGKLTGTTRHRLCDARPRRHQRLVGRACRVSGFDADDPAARPGRARHDGTRGVSGNRLPADVRADDEMGGADRRRRRIPEFISRAFYTATSGRPGPVVLALPEDMLTDMADVADAQPYRRQTVAPGEESLRQFQELLTAARKPLLIVGGGGWSEARAATSKPLRRRMKCRSAPHSAARIISTICIPPMPVMSASASPRNSASRIRDSDLVIALGARLGEITTSGYSLFDIPQPKQPLVHIYPDPEEIGRVYAPTLGIVSNSAAFAARSAGCSRGISHAATNSRRRMRIISPLPSRPFRPATFSSHGSCGI